MADYPTIATDVTGTQESWVDEVLISRARSGSVKARRVASGKKRMWRLAYRFLSSSEKATLESFYDTNRATTFTFTWNGTPYTVIFGEGPIAFDALKAGLWSASVTLVQV